MKPIISLMSDHGDHRGHGDPAQHCEDGFKYNAWILFCQMELNLLTEQEEDDLGVTFVSHTCH